MTYLITHTQLDQPFYPFIILEDGRRYDFISQGKTSIHKTVVFQMIGQTQYYNLALADLKPFDKLDVYTVSNNGDMKKILATVFQCISEFSKLRPNATVIFTGSTDERTDIYHWLICRERNKTSSHFNFYGFKNGNFIPFNSTESYTAFAISFKYS